MIRRTLFLYLLRHYAVVTGQFLAAILLLVFLVDISEYAGRNAELPEFSYIGALQISLLNLLSLSLQILPFVALFGAMAHLVSLNRRSELVVLRASGVSAWQFLLPALTGAAALGLVASLVINPFAARANAIIGQIEIEMGGTGSSNAVRNLWLRQSSGDGALIFGGRATTSDPTTLSQATLLRIDADDEAESRIDASSVTVEPGFLLLRDVVERFNDGTVERRASERIPASLDPQSMRLALSDPETVPFYELPERIAFARELGSSAASLRTQLQLLIAQPFLLMAMTVIAATVCLRFQRVGLPVRLVAGGVAAGFLLYVITVLAEAFGRSGFVPPVVAAWSPVLLAAFLGLNFLLAKEDG